MMKKWIAGEIRYLRNRLKYFLVLISLVIASVLCIGATYLPDLDLHLASLLQDLGSNLVGAIAAFVAFDIILQGVREERIKEHFRFDSKRVIKSISEARELVRILDTWTVLLDTSKHDFLEALNVALDNNATIQLLLLDPESPAVALRSEEISYEKDVKRSILTNLHELYAFQNSLGPGKREKLSIKVYKAPSISLYMWNDRALVSFFPTGKLSSENTQLEISMKTPLGGFIEQIFLDRWNSDDSKTIDECMLMELKVNDSGEELSYNVIFVQYGDNYYVFDPDLLAYIGNRGANNLTIYFRDNSAQYKPKIIKREELSETNHALFLSKYGRINSLIVYLSQDQSSGGAE